MKKGLLLPFFIAFYLLLNFNSSAQTTIVSSELVLSIPSLTSKSYEEIKLKLFSIPGVNVVAYCDQYKSFLIYFNPKLVETAEDIAREVESLNSRYKTEIKTGTSISQIIDRCSKFSLSEAR